MRLCKDSSNNSLSSDEKGIWYNAKRNIYVYGVGTNHKYGGFYYINYSIGKVKMYRNYATKNYIYYL